jgi:hypothetical protein
MYAMMVARFCFFFLLASFLVDMLVSWVVDIDSFSESFLFFSLSASLLCFLSPWKENDITLIEECDAWQHPPPTNMTTLEQQLVVVHMGTFGDYYIVRLHESLPK